MRTRSGNVLEVRTMTAVLILGVMWFSPSGASAACSAPDCGGPLTFADSAVESVVRTDIPMPSGDIQPADVAEYYRFNGRQGGITSLCGIECLSALNYVNLSLNFDLSDISGLEALSGLEELDLSVCPVSDLSPLEGLTNLSIIRVIDTQVTDFSAFVNNTGIGTGDTIYATGLTFTPSLCAQVNMLRARGVTVFTVDGENPDACPSAEGEGVIEGALEGEGTAEGEGMQAFYQLTVNVTGQGTVFTMPSGGLYAAGTTVTLMSSASFGWVFDHWEGNVADPALATTTITMNQNEIVTLTFVQQSAEGEGEGEGGASSYTLTTLTTGQGSVLTNPLLLSYPAGTVVNVSAYPAKGWAFDHWEGNVADTQVRQTTITMNQNETIRAVFVLITPEGEGNPEGEGIVEGEGAAEGEGAVEGEGEGAAMVTLNIFISGNGNVNTVPSLLEYPLGATVNLTAVPAGGWQFVRWEGNIADPDLASTSITLNQNESITAFFEEDLYVLTVEIVGSGNVERDPDAVSYAPGTLVTLTALAGNGYRFDHWDGLVASPSEMLTTITLDANETVTAYFVENIAEGEGIVEGIEEGVVEGVTEGIPEGTVEGTSEGIAEGVTEGVIEGTPEGVAEGVPEGISEGSDEGTAEGITEGVPEGAAEGVSEGITEGVAEGVTEGAEEGGEGVEEGVSEGTEEGTAETHSADQNGDQRISLTELLRVIQFFNVNGFCCAAPPESTEDGYVPGPGENHSCAPHSSDYNPTDWRISLTELLRLIQFFNIGGYHPCPGQGMEDGFCPGP